MQPNNTLLASACGLFVVVFALDVAGDEQRPTIRVEQEKRGERVFTMVRIAVPTIPDFECDVWCYEDALGQGGSNRTMFGLYHPVEDRCFLLSLKEEALQSRVLAERPPALRDLDVVILSDLVVEEILGIDGERREHDNLVRYFADPDEALDVAVKESIGDENTLPLLFLMNNTRVLQVKRVADENLIMPHKSTYFYPKILTGLLLNKLEPEEKIVVG